MATAVAELTDFKLLSGKNLVARDINGKSDPYYIIGLCDDSGRFTGPAPVKSQCINATLSPVWLHTGPVRASVSASLPIQKAVGIRIEIWDADLIGKDEFMGEAIALFKDMLSTYKTQYWTLPLGPRASKPKEKITGQVVASFKYHTKAWEAKLKQDEDMARRKRIQDAEAAARMTESATSAFKQVRASELRLQLEREMAMAMQHELAVQEQIHSLNSTMPAHQLNLSLDRVNQAAKQFVLATGGGPNTAIRSKEQLRDTLLRLGVFEEVARYVFWSGARSAGIDAATADTVAKQGAREDALVVESQNLQVWEMFDLDRDGSVTFQELIAGLAMHSNADARARAEFYFQIFDKDGDGSLDRNEATHLLQLQWKCAVGALRGGLVSTLLAHPDLVAVSTEEIKKIGIEIERRIHAMDVPSSLADVVFSVADTDKSGTISRQEYIQYISDPVAQGSLQEAIRSCLMTAQLSTQSVVQEKLTEIFSTTEMKM